MKNIILSILIILIFTCGCTRQEVNNEQQNADAEVQEVAITSNEVAAEAQYIVDETKDETESQNIDKANNEKLHPFEIETQECMKQKDYTTVGMNECVYEEMDKWFAEIDKYIGLLKTVMPEDSYKDLQEAQAKWKEYQEAEFNAINIIYREKQGTIFQNIEAADRNKIVKERVQKLKEFYEILTLE